MLNEIFSSRQKNIQIFSATIIIKNIVSFFLPIPIVSYLKKIWLINLSENINLEGPPAIAYKDFKYIAIAG